MTVTAEDIQKAKQILGLIKAEGTKEGENKDDLKKGEQIDTLKAEYKDYMSKAKEYQEKAEAAKAALASMGCTDGDDTELLSHKKGEDFDLTKAGTEKDNAIVKAFDEKFNALSLLITAKEEENSELKKSIETLTAQVDTISKASTGPRSITTKSFNERFPGVNNEGERALSIKNNRKELTAELIKAARIGEKDQDDFFAKAASTMEFAGVPAGTESEVRLIAQRLKDKHKIVITA